MKVKDLIEAIEYGQNEHKDFLEWDVAVETPLTIDSNMKDDMIYEGKEPDNWTYCKCHGFNTYMFKKKVFTVNIHY